jgi:hypothetical protein
MPFKDPIKHSETIKGYTKKYRLKIYSISYENKTKPSTRVCRTCKTDKPIVGFPKDRYNKEGHKTECRDCGKIKSKKYRETSAEQRAEYAKKHYSENPYRDKDTQLFRLYGITLNQFNYLVKLQDDKCAICGTANPGTRKNWNVDHDHNTGKVRGLLCWSCNSGIGKLKDDPTLLVKAATYLLNTQNVLAGITEL